MDWELSSDDDDGGHGAAAVANDGWSLSGTDGSDSDGALAPPVVKRPRGRPRKIQAEAAEEEPDTGSQLALVANWHDLARPIGEDFFQKCSLVLAAEKRRPKATAAADKVWTCLDYFRLSRGIAIHRNTSEHDIVDVADDLSGTANVGRRYHLSLVGLTPRLFAFGAICSRHKEGRPVVSTQLISGGPCDRHRVFRRSAIGRVQSHRFRFGFDADPV
jgi:hypothetical protein